MAEREVGKKDDLARIERVELEPITDADLLSVAGGTGESFGDGDPFGCDGSIIVSNAATACCQPVIT